MSIMEGYVTSLSQRLLNVYDTTMKNFVKLRQMLDEEKNLRRAKETLLTVALHQLMQEKEKIAALEKNFLDAVIQSTQKSARIQEVEAIEKDLRAKFQEEQRMKLEAELNVSEIQCQLEKMTAKLHEVEGQLINMKSKWVITPFSQLYSGIPRARSFSADAALIQRPIVEHIYTDRGTKRKLSKQDKSSVNRHPMYSKSPKSHGKVIKHRRSTGQTLSAAVEPIIESPPITSTPVDQQSTNDNVFVGAPEKGKVKNSRASSPQGVKTVVQEFEKFSPRDTSKGAVPKKRLFQSSRRGSLKLQEQKMEDSKAAGATCNFEPQSVTSSTNSLADVTKNLKAHESTSTKRCLSPSVCVGRVKKMRAEELKREQKSLLPRLKRIHLSSQKLQQENIRSALLSATRREDVHTLRRLSTLGQAGRLLDVPVVEVFKFTPLHLAASWGHMESARTLLDTGAGLEVKDWVNSTPLHIAAYWGHPMMCRLLLGRGAQINARNCNAETPLHLAARQGHLQVVRLLVDDWWADLDAKDGAGRTPWEVAKYWKKSIVANWLARQHLFKKRVGRQQRSHSLPCNILTEE